jgi:hypothetical protein
VKRLAQAVLKFSIDEYIDMEVVRQVMILSIFIQLLLGVVILCASRQDSHLKLFSEHEVKVSEHLYYNKTDVSNLLRY